MHSAEGKDRIEPRTRAMVRARLRDSRQERDICIIDMSTRGLLATTAFPPARGEIVELTIGRNHLTGQVRWASERRFGVSLRERVSVAALAEGGTRNAELARSVGQAARGDGVLAGLCANPEWLGRLGQFGAMLVLAAGAGLALSELTGANLDPIRQAVSGANH